MTQASFTRHTLATESNPSWLIAEPVLFDIWAAGILKTSSGKLQLVNALSFFTSAFFFAGGMALKIAAVITTLFLGYLCFPQTLLASLDAVFSGLNISDGDFNGNRPWLYELLGYIIVIKSVLFLLGKGFANFIGETCFQLLLALTNMMPLRLIAKGLQKENYVAQLIAKTSFMGMFLSQTIAVTPNSEQWDKVFDLYSKSNDSAAREELEELSARHSKKS